MRPTPDLARSPAAPRVIARRRALVLTLAASTWVLTRPRAADAVELGLTPNDVVGIWTNINQALLFAGDDVVGGRGDAPSLGLGALEPQSFADKRPDDVLAEALRFKELLDQLRKGADLAASESVAFDASLPATPSVVFLTSGKLLNGLCEWLVVHTERRVLISQFYERRAFAGMTPSDAFALVELARRRLARVIEALDDGAGG